VGGESIGESKDKIFIRHSNSNLGQLECNSLHISNPGCHPLAILHLYLSKCCNALSWVLECLTWTCESYLTSKVSGQGSRAKVELGRDRGHCRHCAMLGLAHTQV